MNLLSQYKEHVNWCNIINAFPIGFVEWKEIRLNMTFDKKTGNWIKNK